MATLKAIQFKRSKTAGAKPTVDQLVEGELAINLRDRTIFTKSDQNQIIDLGFAKGGQVDGNVTINGLLTLNGDYTQTGGMQVTGDIYSGAGVSALVYRARNGSFYSRASNETSNAHMWFENANGSERGVLYAKPQLENEGTITMRVKQGTAAGAGNIEFHFISSGGGIFQAPILKATTSITTPTITVNLVNHDFKAFGQYDSQSLVNYVYPGTGETNGVNYLRKIRAKSGGTMWHELCTAQLGQADEMSWWTGNTPQSKQYGIRNDGRMAGRNSLALGTFTTDFPSGDYGNVGVMGDKYLVLGDTVTGLKYIKQGNFDLVGGGYSVASITTDGFRGTSKTLFGRSNDQGLTWLLPGQNSSMVSIRTEIDGNNSGDGQTHLGYNSNGKLYHYFRGTGRVAISMGEGLIVEPGILDIKTGSNRVAIRADGTIDSTQRITMRTGLFLSGDDNTNALSFKAPSGVDGTKTINWDAGIRNGQNKNTVTLKAWGNSFNAEKGNRETVFEVSDSQGYYFYAQRTNPAVTGGIGPVNFKFNGTVETGHIIGLGDITASGTGSFGGNVTMTNGLFVQGGSSITGQAKFGGTADALRIWNAEYGAIFRRSEDKLYIIPTPQNAGESGGISNLRPFYITLSTGKVSMDHDVDIGGGRFKVEVAGTTANQRITVNMASDAIRINAPTQESSNFIQGRKADAPKWYLGIGDGGNVVRMHSYTYSHGIALNSDSVDITKPLKVGNAQLGTDGNITGGSGNFANLNTTLERKVNSGFITYGSTEGWYKFATVTMPQSAATATFTLTGGSGFNDGLNTQCAVNEIVLRTGNGKPPGLNAVLYNRSINGLRNIAYINTGGDNYDIFINVGPFANQMTCSWNASDQVTVEVVGINGTTQSPVDDLPVGYATGQVANVLNNLVDRGKVKRYEADSEIAINSQTGIRIRSNGDKTGSVATMLRNDGGSFYILFTDKNATDGAATVNGDWNSKRPFAISLSTGEVLMNNGIAVRSAALFYNNINIKDNGSINFDKSGANPKNMRIFHAGDASRGNRLEIADDSSYLVYFQRYAAGGIVCSFNNSDMTGVQTLNVGTKINTPQIDSFGVNTTNGLGGNSIVIGDSDTGFRQNGDGILDVYTNAVRRMRFQGSDTYSDMNINAPNVYIRSDIRLKSNFKPIENALDKVEQLDGLIYDKADYIGGEVVHTEAGVIAQNLEKVLPEAIREVDDIKGNKVLTVSTQAQVALLIEAVKTLSAKVKELEAKLN